MSEGKGGKKLRIDNDAPYAVRTRGDKKGGRQNKLGVRMGVKSKEMEKKKSSSFAKAFLPKKIG